MLLTPVAGDKEKEVHYHGGRARSSKRLLSNGSFFSLPFPRKVSEKNPEHLKTSRDVDK